ncbi:MAG: hypothetical protein SGI74_01250 [Oligoflexia bacterium]|nr:hypothetical protein [Oligoflexia bacterium]
MWKTILISLTLLSQSAWCENVLVTLSPGEQKILPISHMTTMTVTNPKAAKVSIIKGAIKITAVRIGTTHVFTKGGKTNIEIVVHSSKLKRAKAQISHWLKNVHGITFLINTNHILLQGEAFRLSDWQVLHKYKKLFKSQIKSEVKLSQELQPALKKAVNDDLNKRSISSAWTENDNGEISIQSNMNKKEKTAVNEVIEDWGLPKAKSTHALELKPMIEIDVVIAEVKKNSLSTLGLQLPGSYSATVIPTSDLSSAAFAFNPLDIVFNAASSRGGGRVLANPKLLCRSGEAAHFVAGGEIPIKIMNTRIHDVIWKRYGVILDITPLADYQNRISTKLVTEVSLIDDSRVIDGIPGLFTNRIETHFDLNGSKTIALSGLIKSELGRSTTSNSLLGEIPILGELFKSRDYKDSKTELVVFVTPRVISPYDTNQKPPQIPQWSDDDL